MPVGLFLPGPGPYNPHNPERGGATANPSATIFRFRGRDDSVALNSATFTYAVNTDWSQAVNVPFRIRFQLSEAAGGLYWETGALECRLNAGAYQNITTSSTIVKAVASSQFNDGDVTTQVLAATTVGTFTAGWGSETGDAADVHLQLQFTENEYALQIVGADVADADTVDIRVKPYTPGAGTLVTLTVVEVALLLGTAPNTDTTVFGSALGTVANTNTAVYASTLGATLNTNSYP